MMLSYDIYTTTLQCKNKDFLSIFRTKTVSRKTTEKQKVQEKLNGSTFSVANQGTLVLVPQTLDFFYRTL